MDIKAIQRQFSLDADTTVSTESHQESTTVAPDCTPVVKLT